MARRNHRRRRPRQRHRHPLRPLLDPDVKRVRERTTATGDAALTEDQAHIEVELTDGRTISTFVAESLGNLKRPMSNAQLDAKFRDQAQDVLPAADVETLLQQCWSIDTLEDVGSAFAASASAASAASARPAF